MADSHDPRDDEPTEEQPPIGDGAQTPPEPSAGYDSAPRGNGTDDLDGDHAPDYELPRVTGYLDAAESGSIGPMSPGLPDSAESPGAAASYAAASANAPADADYDPDMPTEAMAPVGSQDESIGDTGEVDTVAPDPDEPTEAMAPVESANEAPAYPGSDQDQPTEAMAPIGSADAAPTQAIPSVDEPTQGIPPVESQGSAGAAAAGAAAAGGMGASQANAWNGAPQQQYEQPGQQYGQSSAEQHYQQYGQASAGQPYGQPSAGSQFVQPGQQYGQPGQQYSHPSAGQQYQQPGQYYAQPAPQQQYAQYPPPHQPVPAPASADPNDALAGFADGREPVDRAASRGARTAITCLVLMIVAVLALAIAAFFFFRTPQTPAPAPSSAAPSASSSPSEKKSESPTPTELKSPAPEGARTMSDVRSPSGNITCTLSDGEVGCSIEERSTKLCDGEKLGSFVIKDGNVEEACDDSFGTPDPNGSSATGERLGYDESAKNGSVACTSESTGMTCWDEKTGHGFTLSKSKADTF